MEIIIIVIVGFTFGFVGIPLYCRYIDKKQKRKRQEQRTAIFRQFALDFNRIGWTRWGYDAHIKSGQRDRIEKGIYSKRMKLLTFDIAQHTACVMGEHDVAYNIDCDGCSCMDFRTRRLPCKHMYFAVIELSQMVEGGKS